MLKSDSCTARREFEDIGEAAKIEFSGIEDDSKDQIKRAKLAVLRRLHQHENFKTLLECGNLNPMILRNPSFNKGTAFTHEERDRLNIRGLLPPHVETLDEQCGQVVDFLNTLQDDLQKYLFFVNLSERNETVFYKLLCDHPHEYLPLINNSRLIEGHRYCSHLWMFQKGMFLSLNEKGRLRAILDHWIFPKVDIVVITDGSHVLGLGDLGCNSMCTLVEKSMLYVAGGGFHPARTLPIVLDVGTSNDDLRDQDQHYLGMRIHRVEDSIYYPFVDELMQSIHDKWPHAVIQFQDFSRSHARNLLERYRQRFACFNDDIQGLAVVTLSGLLNACRLMKSKMKEQRFLFVGAGTVALGIADYLVQEIAGDNSDESSKLKAKESIWMMDKQGILSQSRAHTLSKRKTAYMRNDWDKTSYASLQEVIEEIRPTVLIGATNKSNLFDEQILRKMADIQEHPIILILSSSENDAECTFNQAITYTDGRCLFISSHPFGPVTFNGQTYQSNHASTIYAFPGIGLGACLARAASITDKMLLRASHTLATMTPEQDFERSILYPSQSHIRTISHTIAMAILDQALEENVARVARPDYPLRDYIRNSMYYPQYP